MAAIFAFGPTILDIAFNRTIGPVVRHISYPFKCNSNVAKLKDQLQELEVTRESVKHEVDEETINGKVIEKEVDKWMVEVQERVERLRGQLYEEEERMQKKCFAGLCPNVKARYQLSKQAEKEAVDLNDLRSRRAEFKRLAYQPALQGIEATAAKDYQVFDSRLQTIKAIKDALVFSNSQMIGLYGVGGVGKSVLVKEVARQAKVEKLFDQVVVAHVDKMPDIMQIQATIGEMLGLKFIEESIEARATRLHERMKREEKILIVLDNLWEKLNLEEVGIPSKEMHKGCTILVTSRDQHLLSSEMDCQNNFQIPVLNQEEAWCLFEKMSGGFSKNTEFLSIAKKVADKCGCLPLAISTVGRALKQKSLSDWKNALLELQRPSPRNFSTEVRGEVYSALQLSYNHLADKELQSTFLLCCQRPGSSLEYLLKYGMGLSLFTNVFTIEEAHDRMKALVHRLMDACLVEEKNRCFDVHDFVRDVGISIASRDENVLVADSEFDLKKWHNQDNRRGLKAICIERCTQLPEELDCPQLHLFVLSSEDRCLKIPDNIYRRMKELRVLEMSNLSLPSLPSSLVNLQSLRTLCLHQSDLEDISFIGELKNLEFLSIWESKLERLPKEIGKLSELRSLDLTACYFLKVIPPNVLSNLSALEELYMGNSFDQWETFEGRKNASLVDLKNLFKLTNLDIHIRDYQVIPDEFFSNKLRRYKIYIGNEWDWDPVKTSRTLKLKLNTDICTERYGIRILMKTAEELYLDEVEGIETVLYRLNSEGFPLLKYLHLQNHSKVKHLVVSPTNWVPSNNAFPILESLVLNNLVSLEKFYSGILGTESFGKLRILEVNKCPKLKYLLTSTMAKSLSQLQKMAVSGCENLELIVADESEANDTICFSQLCSLSLEGVPHLKCFYSKVDDPMATEQIILEDKYRSSRRTSLFNAKVIFPNLEDVKLCSIDVDNIWHEQLVDLSSWACKLATLDVQGCGNLRYLFPSSMVTSLQKLKRLEVLDCKFMKEVVNTEGGETEMTSPFPELHFLKLACLPELSRFCVGKSIELFSLEHLSIRQCPSMKTFITDPLDSVDMNSTLFDQKVAFPNLEILHIKQMDHLKMIWHGQFHPSSFCKLKQLEVLYGKELLNIFPPKTFLTRFLNLEELIIMNCDSLQVVFDQLTSSQESNLGTASQLRELHIMDVPKLKFVWKCNETNNLQGIVSFHNLRQVKVADCPTLEALFPASVAKDLPYLEDLFICKCNGLKEIVSKDREDAHGAPHFEFPKLTSIWLIQLTELTTFYPGMYTSEWPMLLRLHVFLCQGMTVFDTGLHAQDLIPQPFLSVETIINLEELLLNNYYVRQLPTGPFYRIKILHLSLIATESIIFPFYLLKKFPNLETLSVMHGHLTDLFPHEEERGDTEILGRMTIQRLRHVMLTGIVGLEHIWNPDSRLCNDLLQNLETLRLWSCPNLVELAPSSLSFQSLTVLEVFKCKRLTSILSPTTAKSLVQLTEMCIKECDMVTEIVDEGDELDDTIIFVKLTSLRLLLLPSLSRFCSAKHSLKFPQLTQLLVENCSKMMVFSEGALSTPKLKGVKTSDADHSEGLWYGNLNHTVDMMFNDV